jgi:hypothetical protein
MDHADEEQLARGVDEEVDEGHEGEHRRAEEQQATATVPVGKRADQRRGDQAGRGRDGHDDARHLRASPQRSGEEGEQGALAHLIAGPGDQVHGEQPQEVDAPSVGPVSDRLGANRVGRWEYGHVGSDSFHSISHLSCASTGGTQIHADPR